MVLHLLTEYSRLMPREGRTAQWLLFIWTLCSLFITSPTTLGQQRVDVRFNGRKENLHSLWTPRLWS